MSNYAKRTKYPKIYENTYWGGFQCDERVNNDDKLNTIFENRNKFIENFNIKKITKSTPNITVSLNIEFSDDVKKFIGQNALHRMRELKERFKWNIPDSQWYDHVEVYETHDEKIIVVSSPYQKNDEHYRDFLERTGFINMTEPFYSRAISCYKIYDKNETKMSYLTERLKQMLNRRE